MSADRRLSEWLTALAEPTRRKIVSLLVGGERCVSSLEKPLGMTQPAVSHHLSALLGAGVVTRRRDGKFNYYALAHHAVTTNGYVELYLMDGSGEFPQAFVKFRPTPEGGK